MKIVVSHDYHFTVIATIDSGVDMNCIQEGLIRSKYFEKSIERLVSANCSQIKIKYELNNAQISSIVLCISKFQSDLLNQKFLLRIDCKSAKYVIEKYVENIASKHIFAIWQAILSVFNFDIE